MSRYTMTKGMGRRLTDHVTGDTLFIKPHDAAEFDDAYRDLMESYHDCEETVLAIMWENYRDHTDDEADTIRYK